MPTSTMFTRLYKPMSQHGLNEVGIAEQMMKAAVEQGSGSRQKKIPYVEGRLDEPSFESRNLE